MDLDNSHFEDWNKIDSYVARYMSVPWRTWRAGVRAKVGEGPPGESGPSGHPGNSIADESLRQ